ncbi:MAG: hypothetical protein ABIG85_04820 [Chloroflexota bacterium]
MYASRDRKRGRARLLYWFRTPPNVRVGRAALDEEAIRSIEESNPNLTFDWTRMLKARPVEPPPAERGGREPWGHDRAGRSGKGRKTRQAARPAPATAPEPEAPVSPRPTPEDMEAPAPVATGSEPRAVPADVRTDGEDEVTRDEERPPLPPGLHVEERLGREGFSRLRTRYAELMARIAERVQDPARLEELRGQAERLNPGAWITDEEARDAIDGFDAAYEAIRTRLGRRRRRSRRGGARRKRPRKARDTLAGATEGTGKIETDGPAGGGGEVSPSVKDSRPE